MHKHPILALALLAAASAQAGELHRAANREVSFSVGAQQLDYAEYRPMDLTAGGLNNPQRSELDFEHGGQGAAQLSIGFQGEVPASTTCTHGSSSRPARVKPDTPGTSRIPPATS